MRRTNYTQRSRLSMVSEITVIVKDDEKSLRKKFLSYETYTVDDNDPLIKSYIEETLSNFDGEPEKVSVKISMEIN